MSEPWAFGWTQVFTLIGFLITIVIAIGGFGTFERWRRQKLEERRIDVAFDALTIAHETKFIFGNIRSALAQNYEWADMPQWEGDTEDTRMRRGPYFASIKRINANKEFFERVWHVQPRCMALFGPQVEATFMKLHQARRHIEVAAQMLSQDAYQGREDATDDTRTLYEQLRRDLWDHGNFEAERDRVGKLLTEFVQEVIAFAQPAVERQYKGRSLPKWSWKSLIGK